MSTALWKNLFRTDEAGRDAILKANVLFQDLSPRQLKFLAGIVHVRQYQAGETVFKQDDVGVGMYIISRGTVEIRGHDSQAHALDGTADVLIASLGSGDFFGELALVEENGRRSATAVATEETELIGFFKPNLIELLERNPAAGVKITMRLSEVLGKRLRETNEMLTRITEKQKQAVTHGDRNL